MAGETNKTDDRKLCFVIGPIGKPDSDIRTHADYLLNAIIKEVLEAEPFNIRVQRADHDNDPGMINDAIIHDILNADLAIADLSLSNPNAYYELGLRHMTDKPVIAIAEADTNIASDIMGQRAIFYNRLKWSTILDARARLAEAARLALSGTSISNPVTQYRGKRSLFEKSDTSSDLLLQLMRRVDELEHYDRGMSRSLQQDAYKILTESGLISLSQPYGYVESRIADILSDTHKPASKRILELKKVRSIAESSSGLSGRQLNMWTDAYHRLINTKDSDSND